MSKFKVGDRVVSRSPQTILLEYKGVEGQVKQVFEDGTITIVYPDGVLQVGCIYLDDLHHPGKDNQGYDPVNKPIHYGSGKIEAIEYIEDFLTREEYIGYLRGNIAKYMHRFRYKNGVEDLQKAQWYLGRLIETMRDA
ncbi:MAG TPA: DUF3310 domain-containing protein [Candidatus Obscuribacterales bacterium]